MSVSMKPFDVQVHEINVKINTFKIGDGLIFGYVPRRSIFFCERAQPIQITKNEYYD